MAIFPLNPPFMPPLHYIQTSFQNKEPSRDKRIQRGILADALDEEGIMLAWYSYLAESLNFPFTAIVFSYREGTGTYYHQFQVLRMAPLERCGKFQMWAIGKPSIAVMEHFYSHLFISDIYSAEKEKTRFQAIEDWIYWRKYNQVDPLLE